VHARKHPKRRLSVSNLPLVKARNRYYNVIRKAGVTRSELGVTSHGLRHEFAARKYEQLTGMRPQVEAVQPSSHYRENDEQDHLARLEISQQLGHWRKDVTSAYIGSTTTLARESRSRIKANINLIESNEAAIRTLRECEISRMWLTGKSAWGLPLSLHEKLNLTVQIDRNLNMPELNARIGTLVQRLDALVERGVSITLHLGPGQPQDSLEIFIGHRT
jgi:hypothetical protein